MSVVIPAGDVGALPLLLSTLPPVDEVIVVVGGDADTGCALPRAARVVRQTRTGVGNALACGVAVSTGDVVVTLPGDGSCDPAELPLLIEALRAGADVVHGSRYLAGARDHSGSLPARCADLILLWFVRVLFGGRPTDPGFGYRAFWRDTTGRLGLPRVAGTEPVRGDGAEIESLLTVRTALAGLRGAEVPATAYPRTGAAPLVPAVRALIAEYANRRRPAGTEDSESIVVLTGTEPATPVAAAAQAHDLPSPLINGAPAVDGRYPAYGTHDRRWPAPNDRRRTGSPDAPNSGSLPGDVGFVERRRGERRVLDRRSVARDLPHPVRGTPRLDGEITGRRRWRDNRTEATVGLDSGRRRGQGRPNLRVINGEGTGGTGNRGGHLRSV